MAGDAGERTDREDAAGYLHQFDRVMIGASGVGLVVTILYGIAAARCPAVSVGSDASSCVAAYFTSLMIALAIVLAALAIGTLIGFLFGLPRTLTSDTVRDRRDHVDWPDDDDRGGRLGAEVNTNLERISNWLTTIIVGLGLAKLESVPAALDRFGDRVSPIFSFGGSAFAIGGGLFFLIMGFFLGYVGTRVRLSHVFLMSQVSYARVSGLSGKDIAAARNAPPLPPEPHETGTEPSRADPDLKRSDEAILSRSLRDLTNDDEIIAWANAKARAGDPQSALTAYRDVARRVSFDSRQTKDLAVILASTGNLAGAGSVIDAFKVSGGEEMTGERALREQVSSIVLQNRLRNGLYGDPADKAYEDAIEAGEELVARPEGAAIAINHLWLACAYAQRLAVERSEDEADETLSKTQDAAVTALAHAIEREPGLRDLARKLAYPALQIGADNDLQSIDPKLLKPLIGPLPGTATGLSPA